MLGTMSLCVSVRIMFLVAVHGITRGYAFSDVDMCIQKYKSDSRIFELEFCPITRIDLDITCPPETYVVFYSVKFAVKQIADTCTKRVLASKNTYCCRAQDSDIFYDGDCLQGVWSSEDRQQYERFISESLERCKNTLSCLLTARMFNNLQRKIPTTKKYSSYIQIRHQCIKEPAHKVELCSKQSVRGMGIHIHGSLPSTEDDRITCRCHVTSNNPVMVRAVDVRTPNSRIILKSDNRVKEIASNNGPMFGLREIFTARKFDIIMEQISEKSSDGVWLEIQGSNRQVISVTCGEDVHEATALSQDIASKQKTTPRSPSLIAHEKDDPGYKGHTLMIYAAVGSGLTILLTVFIFGCYFICRYCMKKKRHPYEKPYDRQFSGQYDAVYGGMPHPPPEWMNTGVKQDQRTSTMRSLHKPMAPTLPPPNKHGLVPSDHTQSSHNPMTTSGTSDFDAFLGN